MKLSTSKCPNRLCVRPTISMTTIHVYLIQLVSTSSIRWFIHSTVLKAGIDSNANPFWYILNISVFASSKLIRNFYFHSTLCDRIVAKQHFISLAVRTIAHRYRQLVNYPFYLIQVMHTLQYISFMYLSWPERLHRHAHLSIQPFCGPVRLHMSHAHSSLGES